MPNDIPDWTSQNSTLLVGQNPARVPLGDTSSAVLDKDAGRDTITYGPGIGGGSGVLASFKPAAGATIARVGAAGPFTTGTLAAVNPTFGQATVAAHLLVAWVESGTAEPTTGAAGWVKIISVNGGGGWTAIWAKPNCGAAEAAPAFTAVGGTSAMFAQLAEFSGAALAGATDQTGSANTAGLVCTVTATAVDAALGDLVILCVRWLLNPGSGPTFSDSFNNGAAAVQVGSGDSTQNGVARAASFTYGIIPPTQSPLPLGVAPWPYDASATLAPGAGVQATVTLAANPTKRYIAAALFASMQATTAAAQSQDVQLVDGVTVLLNQNLAAQAVIGSEQHMELSGLAYPGTVNTAMTFKFGAVAAGALERVAIGAYLR